MPCWPAGRFSTVLAVPFPASATVPRVELPSRNVTLPLGVPCPAVTVTVAVKVTASPAFAGFLLEINPVAVVAWLTVCGTLGLWSAPKSVVLGTKTARRFLLPAAVGVKEHTPTATGAVQLPAP